MANKNITPGKLIESEKKLERFLVKEIESELKGLCWKMFPLHITGLPDRLCLLPDAEIFFVEVKTTGQKSRPRQIYVQNQLRKLGFRVEEVDSTSQIENLIQEFKA